MTAPDVYHQDAFFIDGVWSRPLSGESAEVISPATELSIGSYPVATTGDIDAAVAAARRSFDEGPWPGTPLAERCAVLERAADTLDRYAREIGVLITHEMGAPLSLSGVLVPQGISIMREACQLARELKFEEVRDTPRGRSVIRRQPVGVVAAIAPWNAPFVTAVAKVVPALLTGCTVVYKPAPETPLDLLFMAEALREAGLPAGAFNVVPADREVSEHLVAHPGVDMISFTGSTAAGRRIGVVCGDLVRHCHLELGGKSAAIVCEDADLDETVPALSSVFRNSGQICASLSRVLAPASLYDEVVSRLCDVAGKLVVGDPLAEATEMGPLVAERQRTRVEGYLDIARDEGVEVMAGGGRPAGLDRGWFIEPTVLAGVHNSMRIAREEIFGPVVSVIRYGPDDDPAAIANDSEYGLHGAVFSTDHEQAYRIASRVRSGSFTINNNRINVSAPFGGMKRSGTAGREFGPEGFADFLDVRTINVPADFRP